MANRWGGAVETVRDFILGGSEITADGDCIHEIKRHLLLGRKSPLDCKEIQPVHPKGDQSWVFIGMTDVEAETPVLWPPHVKSWLIGKDRCWEGLGSGGEGDNRGWDGWMASLTRWIWVWVNSRSWWWTGRPGMLRFMRSQRVRHNWGTELNWTEAETPILWPPDVKSWLIWKDPDPGEDWRREKKGRQRMKLLDGIPGSMDMSLNKLKSWWCTGKPGVLQSMGSQSQTGLSDWTELNSSRSNHAIRCYLSLPLPDNRALFTIIIAFSPTNTPYRAK